MICHNCGSKIEHFTRFCSTCGVEQAASEDPGSGADINLKTTQLEKPEIRVPRWRLSKMEGVKIPDGFPLQAQTRIGRDPRCEIQLPSPNISRFHAQIEWSDTGFQISDLGSTNGTYVNRRLIKEPTRLKIGATIQLGEYSFLVMKDSTICSNCGETVRSDDRFCQYCGNSLIEPQLRPARQESSERSVEEPFPETTPVPIVSEDSGGLLTPRFSTPPYIPGRERPTVREKPAPPATPAPVVRSATAPPAPPAPPPPSADAVPAGSAKTGLRTGSPLRTCALILLLGLCAVVALGAAGYYIYTTGWFN